MNDEIKEIIDRLERIDHKKYSGGFEFADSGTFDKTVRCFEERKKMADYITNLQQENERLKEIIENLTTMTVCGDRKQIKNTAQYKLEDYKSRCEKAIEYVENMNAILWNEAHKYNIDFEDLLNILQNGSKYE